MILDAPARLLRGAAVLLLLVGTGAASAQAIDPTRSPPARDDEIRFVVMADRTGGMRRGVFEEGIRWVNDLHPEFVMSVGDLIDGYTDDAGTLEDQWAEFDEILAGLDVPFKPVAGNHDISNPWMEAQWRERLGSPWYHFLYKDALFLVLHTEDGGASGIGAEQAADVVKILEGNRGVRWTFVFMHRPLWHYGNQEGFDPIDAALAGRDYTLFSGHHHNYLHTRRQNADHYILATTGGGSWLRGERFGEFDHVTHVTLTEDGPKVTLIRLDGFVPADVVSEANEESVQALRKGGFFSIDPVVADSSESSTVETRLTLRNPGNLPMRIHGEIPPPREGWVVEPAEVDETLEAGEERVLGLRLGGPGGVASLPRFSVVLDGSVTQGENTPLTLPAERAFVLDWVRPLPRIGGEPAVAGVLAAEPPTPWIGLTPPGFAREGWDYKGADDAEMRFAFWESDDSLVLRAEVHDDVWLFEDPTLRDQWTLYLGSGDTAREVVIAPPSADDLAWHPEGSPEGTAAAIRFDGPDAAFAVTIPKRGLGLADNTESVRFNLRFMDHDRPENQKPSRLFWKAPWGDRAEAPGSGTFRRR